MTTELWIGPFDYPTFGSVGETAFLVRQSNPVKGWQSYMLRDTPARTNQSHEYRLTGWCGSYNDTSTHAEGAVEIVKVAKNGRLKVRRLDNSKLRDMLDEYGFPELMP